MIIEPHIRWMIRLDMTEVLAIESAIFQYPWQEQDFVNCLRQRNCVGMVSEWHERIVGYMLYEIHSGSLHVLNFAVHPDFRRQGVGYAMIRKLAGKLSPKRKKCIQLEVRETNLDAQKFFRACGFRAVKLLKNFYEDTPDDAYLMWYDVRPDDCPSYYEKSLATT